MTTPPTTRIDGVPDDDVHIGVPELAIWLKKAESTIAVDVRRRPETLPPVTWLPGSTRPRWRVGDVKVWLEQFAPVL